jgi:hypothetical protein
MSETKGKELSFSTKKNLKMVVYHNVGPDGKKFSITRFESLRSDRPQYKRIFPKRGGAA